MDNNNPMDKIAVQICGSSQKNFPLDGSNKNSKSQFRNIQLPKLPFIKATDENPLNQKPIRFGAVNLDQIKNLQAALEIQDRRLQNLESPAVYFNNISIWTIIIYALLFSFIGGLR